MTGFAIAVTAILAVSFFGSVALKLREARHAEPEPVAFRHDDWAREWEAVWALDAREPRASA